MRFLTKYFCWLDWSVKWHTIIGQHCVRNYNYRCINKTVFQSTYMTVPMLNAHSNKGMDCIQMN